MEDIFAKMEAYLDKKDDLYFQDVTSFQSTNTIDAVLECLQINNEHYTLFVSDNTTQCRYFKRRSIGDIYKIVKHYLPDTKIEEIKKGLEYHCNNSKLMTLICPDIHKRVWRYVRYSGGKFCSYNMDEYGLTYDIEFPASSIYKDAEEEKSYLNMINL